MNGRGRLNDLPHVVLLEVLRPVPLVLVILPAAEVLGVGVGREAGLVWEPHLTNEKTVLRELTNRRPVFPGHSGRR